MKTGPQALESTFAASNRGRWQLLGLVYAALIVYGSLFPFAGWRASAQLFAFLTPEWPHHWRRTDMVINVLAYVPLGFLLARAWSRRTTYAAIALLATLSGTMLSFTLESAQQFLPSRVASLADLITNTLGALVGAMLAGFLHPDSVTGETLSRWRTRWFRPGRLADLGLIAIGLWAASQLAPFVPTVDIGELRHGLAPLWETLRHPGRFDFVRWGAYATDIAGLALLARTLGKPGRSVMRLFFAFVACVLILKAPIQTRQLSLEAITGALAAVIAASLMKQMRLSSLARASALLLLGGFAIAETAKGGNAAVYPFSWVPFTAQLEQPLVGILSILGDLWPAASLAYLVRFASRPDRRRTVAWIGGIALTGIVFVLEWHQQRIPGRVGDITTVLLMTGTWAFFWAVHLPAIASPAQAEMPTTRRREAGRRAWVGAGALLFTTGIAAAVVIAAHVPRESRVDESKLPQLPAPAQLPPASLPGFRLAHPRLPSPSPSDLATLEAENPDFLRQVRTRAAGGTGDFDSVILEALVDPRSVDLALLERRLGALKVTWRGHEQVKPLALAYDWLYGSWSDAQRAELREKLVDGCEYLVNLIRKDRLSPYNVILYNAPFQALVACSIALYRDDPRADAIMAFTHDLWKNRVLPAWRQVMGRNGGWHEGGEYVGVGIGQAIYQVPAMWRHATGEDLFASEPGIRGFLDFLVYRTRPDGTHFRWGDGAWFDRQVPDAIALALEFRHAAAYSLRPPAKGTAPSSWPWGPLTDASLVDPSAASRLPLARYFDGLGLIVARGDWSPQATYVTFKAGDNYWSHSHLDQGAFTIFKGGPLAIDSGLYGPSYGSDHHMNYSYQTIAHNTVTVTDPQDRIAAPGRKQPRSIANDGGQRRVGSGWGVEAAPIDLAEWEAKRDTYHTGALEQVLADDGLTVAVADITPAYTNRRSGDGTFSDRTRRVERFWRTFGYDRIDDVVVVFDQVVATKDSFRKRWLLHTLEQPRVTNTGFVVSIPAQHRPGRDGGLLEGKVLLPKQAVVNALGGRNLEFFVDDANYAEAGKLYGTIRKLGPSQGEPGAWRVEVSPPQDQAADLFLVVMLPTSGAAATHRVRLLESEHRVGCEIAGPTRTTRWWFERERNAAEIEIVEGEVQVRRHSIEGRSNPPPARPGWIARLIGMQ